VAGFPIHGGALEQYPRVYGRLPESQGHNLALQDLALAVDIRWPAFLFTVVRWLRVFGFDLLFTNPFCFIEVLPVTSSNVFIEVLPVTSSKYYPLLPVTLPPVTFTSSDVPFIIYF